MLKKIFFKIILFHMKNILYIYYNYIDGIVELNKEEEAEK